MSAQGGARLGLSRQGVVRPGRPGVAWLGQDELGLAVQAGRFMSRPGQARTGSMRQGRLGAAILARPGRSRLGLARRGKARPSRFGTPWHGLPLARRGQAVKSG